MAVNKTTFLLNILQAYATARYQILKQQNALLFEQMKNYKMDNADIYLEHIKGFECATFSPYASLYLNSALKELNFNGFKMLNNDNGSILIGTPKENAYKLEELRRLVDKQAMNFCTDKEELEKHLNSKEGNDQIITTQKGSLTDFQLFMMASELTNKNAFYSIDAENKTLSYLKSQEREVKQALYACAAEISSKDTNYYKHYFKKQGELYEALADIKTLKDGDCKYIVSQDRINKNGIYALKITNNSYTEIYKDKFDKVKEGKNIPINFNDDNEFSSLCFKTMKYNKPVLADKEFLESITPERFIDIEEAVASKTMRTYGSYSRDENDELTVNFIRNAYKNNIQINLYNKNSAEDIYNDIKQYCENSEDIKVKMAWENIKDIPRENVEIVLSSYKANALEMNEDIIKRAEPEKIKNKDRE